MITLPGGGGLRAWTGWPEDVRALEAGSFDTAILFPNSYGSARIASKANIRERWGYASDMRGGLLTRAIPKPHGDLHQRAYYQALTKALGIPEGPPYASIRPDGAHARQLLRDVGLDLDEPFVVFAPGAAYGRAKQWLPERYAELAELIINERGWSVLMVGAKVDRSACDDIDAAIAEDRHAHQPADRFLRQERSADARGHPRRGARCRVERFRRDAPRRRRRHEGGRRLRADSREADIAAVGRA